MKARGESGGQYTIRGAIGGVQGKDASISAARSLSNQTTGTTLVSIGRDDPTTAEAQRAATILRILQGTTQLLQDSPWIKNIWFPGDDLCLVWPEKWSKEPQNIPINSSPPDIQLLNSSQQEAVNTMLSSDDGNRITIVQGPPGTGKTSVIAAYVQMAIAAGLDGIWLVAQSNVAVKNIAEKLEKANFHDYRLLVSKDFHFQWCVFFFQKLLAIDTY